MFVVTQTTRVLCRKPEEFIGTKESEDVYDNPDDQTQWARVAV